MLRSAYGSQNGFFHHISILSTRSYRCLYNSSTFGRSYSGRD